MKHKNLEDSYEAKLKKAQEEFIRLGGTIEELQNVELPLCTVNDLQTCNELIRLGGTIKEFIELRKHWEVNEIMFDYLILKELRKLSKELKK